MTRTSCRHYSTGTADIEYAFPFLPEGEFGELEGIAHRGDFDLRSHMEGKLNEKTCPLELELGADGKPKWRGSGRDLTYRDDITGERYTPHVIEPSAGADRATLAFLCEAYTEDEAPDENGKMQTRIVMKLHPRVAPIKAAVFPLVKKDGMPEVAQQIYRDLKPHFECVLRRKGSGRTSLSPPRRSRHTLLYHRRRPDARRQHRDDSRSRLAGTMASEGRRLRRRDRGARKPRFTIRRTELVPWQTK